MRDVYGEPVALDRHRNPFYLFQHPVAFHADALVDGPTPDSKIVSSQLPSG
jgi:hypothetical protein